MSNNNKGNPPRDFVHEIFGVHCPHWTTIISWTIGILVMASLTIRDIRPLLDDYLDVEENTQVQIKVRRGDEEFQRPNVYLTLQLASNESFLNFSKSLYENLTLGSECHQCERMAEYRLDVWTRWNTSMLRQLDPVTNSSSSSIIFATLLSTSFVNRLAQLDPYQRRKFLNVANLDWNLPVVFSLASFLSNKSNAERGFVLGESDYDHLSFDTNNDRSLESLYSTLVSFVCEFVKIYDNYETLDPLSQDWCEDTFSNSSSLILNFDNQQTFNLRLPLDRIATDTFALDLPWIYFDGYMAKRDGVDFAILMENSLHTEFPDLIYYSQPNDDRNVNREHVVLYYYVQTEVVEEREHKLHTCYRESSKIDCEWNCRAERLEELCGCRSFLNRNASSVSEADRITNTTSIDHHNPYCNERDFTQCEYRFMNSSADCSTYCKEPCHFTTYQWEVLKVLDYSNSTGFSMRVKPNRRSYLEFTMKVKDSSENLISQIGGIFNFYLGLSGLSIVFFLIYLFESWRRWRRFFTRGKMRPKNDEDEAKFVLWHWRWIQLTTPTMVMVNHKNNATKETESDVSKEIAALKEKLDASMRRIEKLDASMGNYKQLEQRMMEEMYKMRKKAEGVESIVIRRFEELAKRMEVLELLIQDRCVRL